MDIKFKTLLFSGIIAAAIAASALDLDSARKQGLVKELPNGYIETVKPEAKTLVDEVNAKRKAHYEQIAKESKLDVGIVGQQAAEKIKEKINSNK